MKIKLINHHLIQEGDAYGLIYALILSRVLNVGDSRLYGLFYINADDFRTNQGYKDQVSRRFAYFQSFGLLGTRLKLVWCSFSRAVPLLEIKTLPEYRDSIVIRANETLFNSNPRYVSLVLTGQENDPSRKLDSIGVDYSLRSGDSIQAISQRYQAIRLQKPEATVDDARASLSMDVFAEHRADFEDACRVAAFGEIGRTCPDLIEVIFGYISRSTDYVLNCVRKRGFLPVTQALRTAVLESTRDYTEGNDTYIKEFMKALTEKYVQKRRKSHLSRAFYKWQEFTTQYNRDDFVVLLFWIRGAKSGEHQALYGSGGISPGKPQHHTNLTLYKFIRALVTTMAVFIQRPILFVPIGDELKELSEDGTDYAYCKGPKEYNLIRFWERQPFVERPMGAQINFLLRLAMNHQVIQMGMRSGSMERLMYLGVPTIYFDRTLEVEGLPNPIGATRIRQLCGFQLHTVDELRKYCADIIRYFEQGASRTSGFPLFFHIENRDTGYLRYSDTPNVRVAGMIGQLMGEFKLECYNKYKTALLQKNYLKNHLTRYILRGDPCGDIGALARGETDKLTMILWFITVIYPHYLDLYERGQLAPVPKLNYSTENAWENAWGEDLRDHAWENAWGEDLRDHIREEDRRVEKLRANRVTRRQEEVDFTGFPSLFESD